MNYFHRRRLRKHARQILHEAKHTRLMREDVADPGDLASLSEAIDAARDAYAGDDPGVLEERLEGLAKTLSRVSPPRPYARIRENVEIFAVAIIVAMGFRTYFIQPFKIPTGSMEPTLYGIKIDRDAEPGWTDVPPVRYLKFLVTGKRFVQVKAKTDGYVSIAEDRMRRQMYFVVSPSPGSPAGARHKFHRDMRLYVSPGQRVSEGQVLAQGMIRSGDHIFVDKVRYNFSRPKRGQVVVFRTEGIDHPQILPTDHYIKRLAALPGETVRIDPPYLVVDGERITEPYGFHRLLNARDQGYSGYSLARSESTPAPALAQRSDELTLGPAEFLPLGDNTDFSLDGRYFGGVPTDSILGPAFAVYWPFGPRWGRVR